MLVVEAAAHRHRKSNIISLFLNFLRNNANAKDNSPNRTCQPQQPTTHRNHASRSPPTKRARRRHSSSHLRARRQQTSPPHAQSRRAPQDLPPNRHCAFSRRLSILRAPAASAHIVRQPRTTRDIQLENHLHSPWPAPSS